MFGMGFTEIFIIAIVAIIALGPEKLPSAMVDIAKFFKKLKSSVDDAKSTIDSELNITDMKNQANQFKAQIDGAKDNLSLDYLGSITDDSIEEDFTKNEKKIEKKIKKAATPQGAVKRDKVSFKKKKKKEKAPDATQESKEA
ncbi:MAG: Sec-independent protein translocase protein TatB [Campylobacterota bacterium]|nr:Sec-independent protein translocase protein TatB [Campylobacterota bacterium]